MTPLAALPFFRIANYLEAGLWCAIGLVFVVVASTRCETRPDSVIAAITFFIFGFSDVVEAQDFSGAWYRPWWLLIWKGLCVVVFVCLLVEHVRRRRRRR